VVNKKPSSFLKRVQLVFTSRTTAPINIGNGFPQIICTPKSPPQAETCQRTNPRILAGIIFKSFNKELKEIFNLSSPPQRRQGFLFNSYGAFYQHSYFIIQYFHKAALYIKICQMILLVF